MHTEIIHKFKLDTGCVLVKLIFMPYVSNDLKFDVEKKLIFLIIFSEKFK